MTSQGKPLSAHWERRLVKESFKEFKNMVENQADKRIKVLHTDNGTVQVNREFQDYLKKCGIVH
jgi:hypothetical protein